MYRLPPLANALSAPIYKFSPNGRWRLNPFDLNCREGELTMAEVSRNADFFKAWYAGCPARRAR